LAGDRAEISTALDAKKSWVGRKMRMSEENESSGKESYKLWWDYLQRSPKYKEYCTRRDSLRPEELDVFLERAFEKFGNVHTTSFDEWWDKGYIGHALIAENIHVNRLIVPLEE